MKAMKAGVDPSLTLSRFYTATEAHAEPESRSQTRPEARTEVRPVDPERWAAWQRVVDHTLIEWGCDPSALVDDGLPGPSRDTISLACIVAARYRDMGAPAPQRVCPDTAGGIVFEKARGAILETLRIAPNGTVELVVFEGDR